MSTFIPSTTGGSSGPVGNPSYTYESIGQGTSGAGTTLNASSTAGNKGAPVAIGTTTQEWSGITIYAGNQNSASSRFALDLSFDGGSTWVVTNIYFASGLATGTTASVFVPIHVPSGTTITARISGNNVDSFANFMITGTVSDPSSPPGFDTSTNTFDQPNTRPIANTKGIAASNTASWVELISSTSEMGAVLVSIDCDGSGTGNTQSMTASLALGPSGSESPILTVFANQLATGNPAIHNAVSGPYYVHIPAGSRLSASAVCATAVTANVLVGIHGFN